MAWHSMPPKLAWACLFFGQDPHADHPEAPLFADLVPNVACAPSTPRLPTPSSTFGFEYAVTTHETDGTCRKSPYG